MDAQPMPMTAADTGGFEVAFPLLGRCPAPNRLGSPGSRWRDALLAHLAPILRPRSGAGSLGAGGGGGCERVEFRLLGELEVRAGGRVVEVGLPRQRAVLAVLAVDAGRPVPAAA